VTGKWSSSRPSLLGSIMNTPKIVYASEEMELAISTAKQIAQTSSPVLIEGESGTGKELIARLIHTSSRRRDRTFVAVNCGAIPETLFESELFGYRAGAFTGAVRDRQGIFEAADGGTLFLDEIGDLSPPMQAKFLRVLQEREVRRVGDTRSSTVDVRVIAATNRVLEQEMRHGRFREDLFFRISVLRLYLPPLRRRTEDIPILSRYFAAKYASRLGKAVPGVSSDVLNLFRDYAWPGNVRELENELHRMVALSNDGLPLSTTMVSSRITEYVSQKLDSVGNGRLKMRLASYEKQIIKEAMERYGWNKTRAAKHLGLTRQGLHRKLHRLNISKSESG
jgi:two-component system response regulator HupR/HoxA